MASNRSLETAGRKGDLFLGDDLVRYFRNFSLFSVSGVATDHGLFNPAVKTPSPQSCRAMASQPPASGRAQAGRIGRPSRRPATPLPGSGAEGLHRQGSIRWNPPPRPLTAASFRAQSKSRGARRYRRHTGGRPSQRLCGSETRALGSLPQTPTAGRLHSHWPTGAKAGPEATAA